MKLMIVAHPDDETLFGGAKLILEKDWKVVCITNGDNKTRRKEFENVMRVLDADYEIWDYPDKRKIFDLSLVKDLRRVCDSDWEYIITHNKEGEYGHTHHKQVCRLVSKIADVSHFEFGDNLPDDIWKQKLSLLSLYQSQKRVIKRFLDLSRREII